MKLLSDLEIEDFQNNPVWQFANDAPGDVDYDHVVPVRTEKQVYDDDSGVMVLFDGVLADNRKVKGIVSVNGNPAEILPGYSFNFDNEWLPLTLPPSPEFVLDKEGPKVFSRHLGEEIDEIFPILITTQVSFSSTGSKLKRLLTINGAKNA